MKVYRIFCLVLVIFYLLLFYEVGFSSENEIKLSPNETYILIDRLLSLSGDSNNIKDNLAKYNKWANLYIKIRSKNLLSKNEMKVYLLIVFISENRMLTQTQEDISFEILSKFEKQPTLFLDVLKELPFFISTSCNALKEHFIITGKNENQKKQFINKYRMVIMQHLGDTYSIKFMTSILN